MEHQQQQPRVTAPVDGGVTSPFATVTNHGGHRKPKDPLTDNPPVKQPRTDNAVEATIVGIKHEPGNEQDASSAVVSTEKAEPALAAEEAPPDKIISLAEPILAEPQATNQAQVAALELVGQKYPTPEQIMAHGVPSKLAHQLAPFQRGGVDFVHTKGGRALIADDMGLGKTIQGVASMAMYSKEWPVLVLCPSGARYHWENEFKQRLGLAANPDENERYSADDGPLLRDEQINVLTTGKCRIFPRKDTKIVICSIDLSPSLIERRKIKTGMFQCAIVDESHMLKNKKAKRVQALLPILQATKRCVLLSGTPALAKPIELWTQVSVLGADVHGWEDEHSFTNKYVGNPRRSAELHRKLRSTVMIRRLKADILKDMPRKIRVKTELTAVGSSKQRAVFRQLMAALRDGNGVLGTLAREHQWEFEREAKKGEFDLDIKPAAEDSATSLHSDSHPSAIVPGSASLHEMYGDSAFAGGLEELANLGGYFGPLKVVTRLFSLTGKVKIPFIVRALERFLQDPTKGKICIFAHHISVLNAIQDGANLSNEEGDRSFIRIDGKTAAEDRQEQIMAFQSDPSIRVALLGITAAGVAVTLTASSTVWFAELFWTPAILIQAEDRCHRIGQASQVRCTYFVAKGTFDDVLWKLLEKKFRELGEFVEGKEELELVVDKTYKSFKEFQGRTFDNEDDPSDDEASDSDEYSSDDELEFEHQSDSESEDIGEEEGWMTFVQAAVDAEEGSSSDDSGAKFAGNND